MRTPDCNETCAAMPECTVCHRTKPPVGRDVPAALNGSFCDSACEGYRRPPYAGHLWPEELRDDEASRG